MSDLPLPQGARWKLPVSLAGLALLWLIAAAGAGLFEDEAYYWTWSKNLQFGYFDHAPMVAYFIRAGTTALGDTGLGVRLFGPLSMLVAAAAVWRTLSLLGGGQSAVHGALVFCALPIVSGSAVVMTPDTPAMLFWALALWALAERLASGNRLWWLAVGLFAGLGLLSKYSVLFLGAGLALYLVTEKELRRDLMSWPLWVGGLIAIALFAPVVGWNAAHEWVSFLKQMGRAGAAKGYDPRYFPELLGAIFAMFHPLAMGLAGFAFVRWLREGRGLSRGAHLAIATSLPFVLYLVYHAQFARVQGNWPAPLAFAFVVLIAPALRLPGLERLSRSLVPTGLGVAVLLYGYALSPVGLVRGEVDKLNETRGWDAFGATVLARAKSETVAWIATSSYGTTAALRWAWRATPDAPPVIQLNERLRYAFEPSPDPRQLTGPALFVERSRRYDAAFLASRFGSQTLLAPLQRGLDGRAGDYAAVRLENPVDIPLSP